MKAEEKTGRDGEADRTDLSTRSVGRPAQSMAELADIEAIRQLKHAYFRLLDSKEFETSGRAVRRRRNHVVRKRKVLARRARRSRLFPAEVARRPSRSSTSTSVTIRRSP